KAEQWWGCEATTQVRAQIEPRVGGRFDHRMTIERVGEVPTSGRITEFDPPARLAFVWDVPPGGGADAGKPMRIVVDFAEVAGGTEVRLVHSGIPAEHRDLVRAGWSASLERLDALLTRG